MLSMSVPDAANNSEVRFTDSVCWSLALSMSLPAYGSLMSGLELLLIPFRKQWANIRLLFTITPLLVTILLLI